MAATPPTTMNSTWSSAKAARILVNSTGSGLRIRGLVGSCPEGRPQCSRSTSHVFKGRQVCQRRVFHRVPDQRAVHISYRSEHLGVMRCEVLQDVGDLRYEPRIHVMEDILRR